MEQFFEGITYCDYAEAETKGRLLAKPERGMWEKAMREAGVKDVEDCYFVGMFFSLPSTLYVILTILPLLSPLPTPLQFFESMKVTTSNNLTFPNRRFLHQRQRRNRNGLESNPFRREGIRDPRTTSESISHPRPGRDTEPISPIFQRRMTKESYLDFICLEIREIWFVDIRNVYMLLGWHGGVL